MDSTESTVPSVQAPPAASKKPMGKSALGRRYDYKFVIVAIFCVFGTVASSYLLWVDFNQAGGAGQGKPLAKVERRESTVRRKASNTYVWTNARQNEDLYKRDAVQTSTSSSAIIKLNDGSQLEMGENSLIIIDESMAEMSLNFLRGNLTLRRADGVDQKVTVGTDGKAKIEDLPLWLIKPEPLTQLFIIKIPGQPTLRPMDFTWQVKAPKAGENFVVQVSKDKSFGPDLTKTLTPASATDTKISTAVEPGRYFWRVVGGPQEGQKLQSEARQFTVIDLVPFKAISPSRGQKISVWKDLTGVEFKWTSPGREDIDEIGEHSIEVSTDRNFSSIAFNSKIKALAGAANYKGIPAGQLFWRVRSKYGDTESVSTVENFTLERTENLALDLNKPDDNITLGVATTLRFNWTCDAETIDFRWLLETAEGQQVFNYKSKAKIAEWKNPITGNFRWKVQALLNDQVVAETQYRKIAVILGKPIVVLNPVKDGAVHYWDEKDPTPFKFQWEPDLIVDQKDYTYQVDVARDAEFKQLIGSTKLKKAELDSEKMKVPAGSLFWRVQIIDAKNRLVKQSEVTPFKYGLFPPPRAPASIKPETGTVINIVEQEKDLIASWEKVETADEYELTINEINEEAKTEKVAMALVTKDLNTELKALKPGKYKLSIRSIDRLKRKGDPSELKAFTLNTGNPPPAPIVTSPEVQ